MEEVDKIAFGKRVASRRIKLELSQDDLGQEIGMKQQGIDAIEQGRVKRPRLLRELAKALKTTEEWLLWKRGPEERPAGEPGAIQQVPLLDTVAAGKLKNPQSQIPHEDVPLLAFADLGRGDFFALRVERDSDSMNRVSPENSVIIVNRADKTLLTGKFYVFSIKGETTYKRWPGGENNYLEPYSTNPANKPIFYKKKTDLDVIGRVVRTVLDL